MSLEISRFFQIWSLKLRGKKCITVILCCNEEILYQLIESVISKNIIFSQLHFRLNISNYFVYFCSAKENALGRSGVVFTF